MQENYTKLTAKYRKCAQIYNKIFKMNHSLIIQPVRFFLMYYQFFKN